MRLSARPLDLPIGDPLLAATVCAAMSLPAGHGAELRALAADLRHTAQTLRSVLQQLRALAQPGSLWRGAASQAFAAKLAEPPSAHLDQVPVRYEGYAAALTSYAAQLDEARSDLAAAQSTATDAVRAYQVIVARPGAPPTAAREAEEVCWFAAQRYQRRYDQWAADVNRCVNQLAVVDDADQLHNPHGWQAAVDTAAQVFGDVSTITTVLGIVALAVCPPAAPALFAASMATSGIALAADVDRRAQYGEQVTITEFAMDAVGTLPLAGAARGVRSAARAAAHAPHGVSRTGVAVRAYGRTVGRAYRNDLWREPVRTARGSEAAGSARGASTPPLAARFRDNVDEVGSVGLSCVQNTIDHRKEGYVRAAARSPERVVWTPIADLAR
jgi:uncharacterized protein YukE